MRGLNSKAFSAALSSPRWIGRSWVVSLSVDSEKGRSDLATISASHIYPSSSSFFPPFKELLGKSGLAVPQHSYTFNIE